MAFLIESQKTAELPEAVLGTVRFNRIDMTKITVVKPGGALGYSEK